MVRSDSSRLGDEKRGTVSRGALALRPGPRRMGPLERVLRLVVLASSLALISYAVWQVTLTTSLAAVTALLGDEVTQWVLVVLFGCVLIVAEQLARPSGN